MDISEFNKKIRARDFHLEYYPGIRSILIEDIIGTITRTGLFDEHPVMLRHEESHKNSYAKDTEGLLRGLESGQSIHIRNLERIIDAKNPLVKLFFQIQDENAYIADSISCFITPPGGKALSIHHDETDIFTLQLKGNKKWELFGRNVSDRPATYKPEDVEKTREFVVGPGDFFYLPKGTIHQVNGMDNTSVSIAFIYRPITYSTLIRKLTDEFLEMSELGKENAALEVDKSETQRLLLNLKKYIQAIDENDIEFLIHKLASQQKVKQNETLKLLEKIQ
jgi:ribosomal protein L16 Arg81 hydroxylase